MNNADTKKCCNFINGKFCESSNYIEVINPATEEVISYAPESTEIELENAIKCARKAQISWSKKTPYERSKYLREIASKIRNNSSKIARIISEEQGKIISLAEIEVSFTADYMDYMAEWARRIEGEIITSDRLNENILLLRKPVGVVAGILPWNFPFFLIARKMAPALLTGNTIIIKPSEETPNNCFEFSKLVAETDLPNGVFNVVYGTGMIGKKLSESSDIDMISFTGSVSTGEKIMASASRNITKLNLELGGKAPAIVLDDADLETAVNAIVDSRIINSGQVCNCAERVYVQKGISEEFIQRIVTRMENVSYGNPLEGSNISMGPIINKESLNKISQSVELALSQGAKIGCGGKVVDTEKGFYYLPTILLDCDMSMDIMRKEIFGPVLPIQVVENLEEALLYSNDCEYGLTSSIYTRDLSMAMKAANELKFGETYINRENFEAMQGYHAGIKKSGIGGADGKHGLYEYTNTHVIYMQY